MLDFAVLPECEIESERRKRKRRIRVIPFPEFLVVRTKPERCIVVRARDAKHNGASIGGAALMFFPCGDDFLRIFVLQKISRTPNLWSVIACCKMSRFGIRN